MMPDSRTAHTLPVRIGRLRAKTRQDSTVPDTLQICYIQRALPRIAETRPMNTRDIKRQAVLRAVRRSTGLTLAHLSPRADPPPT